MQEYGWKPGLWWATLLLCVWVGSAYCGALRNPFQSVSTSDSSDLSSSDSSSDDDLSSSPPFPDLHAETLLLFQEIEINGAEHPAYSCWDNGSTRCLVTHSYCKSVSLQNEKKTQAPNHIVIRLHDGAIEQSLGT